MLYGSFPLAISFTYGNALMLPDFSDGSDHQESACNAGDQGLMPGLGRSPEEGNGSPLLHSCQKNSMDRGAWWATVMGWQSELND